jgi:hypothetical protein
MGHTRAAVNERQYPFIIELAVDGQELGAQLSRQIVDFHKQRRIVPRHGRSSTRQHRIFYRWCFSDLATARAFLEQFGGVFYKPCIDQIPSEITK